VRLNKRLVNFVYQQMGLLRAARFREDDELRQMFESDDAVGAARQQIKAEQGWAAFKAERDRGYDDPR